MSGRGPDASVLLSRALESAAIRAGCPIIIEGAQERAWQSATFVGARHAITIRAPTSCQFADWLGGIREVEFTVRGHLVAEIEVGSIRAQKGQCQVVVEALTLLDH